MRRFMIFEAVLLAVVGAASAAAADRNASGSAAPEPAVTNLRQALEQGLLEIDLRYRLELVDSETFEKNATASTLRGALTFETAEYHGFFAGVTIETVTAVGNDMLYNNAGVDGLWNGVTDRPVVADPEIIEADRIFLAYRGRYGLEIRAGRFDYTLDNQRFIGIAPWRQNHRSFEALSLSIGRPTTLQAKYAYLRRVYYNNGANPGIDAHLLHLSRELGSGSISGYAYLLDWEDEARALLSSATYGARFVGETRASLVDLLYFAEYARQVDYGDNPENFGLDYVHLGLGVRKGAWTLRGAWELRDGDGTSAVQSPLGTNHGKNGFADRMVVTPPDGSRDAYLRLAMDRDRWSWLLDYHDFRSAETADRLGTEVDFQARYTVAAPLSVYLKVAHYMADTWLTDVTKVMVWAGWTFDNK